MDRDLRLRVIFAALDRLTGPLRAMTGNTRGLARGVAAARNEVRNLERAQAQLGAFKGLENRLRSTNSKLEEARAKTAGLRAEIAATDAPTKRMTAALARAEAAESRLIEVHERQGRDLQELARRLEDAGADVSDLATYEDRLGQNTADANRRLEEQQARLDRLQRAQDRYRRASAAGQRLRSAGRSMIVGGTLAAAPLIAAGVSTATYQSTMTDIAQKAELTRAQAAAIGRQLDAIAPRVAQLPSQLAEGVDTLLGLGASLPQTMQSIEPIARAATAYHAEVTDLANATFASLQNLNVAARDTGHVLDIMAQSGKDGAFELRDMAQYFPQLTAGAAALGMRGTSAVADLSAALQIARRGAGDSATAANNVANLLNKIPNQLTIKNFRSMGVDIMAELARGARAGKSPIETVVEQTIRATHGDMSRLSALFNDAQVQAALRPLIANIGDYRQIRANALRAQGAVERDFNERLRDSAEIYNQNMARLQALGHVVGAALLPTFNRFMEVVGRLADRFSAWAQRNPETVATLARIAAYGAAALVVLGGLAVAIGTLLGPFAYLGVIATRAWPVLRLFGVGLRFVSGGALALGRIALPFLTQAFLALGRGLLRAGAMMLANPVVLVITVIVAALAFAAYEIWKHWDTIKGAFDAALAWLGAAWQRIKSVVMTGAQWLVLPIRIQVAAAFAAWGLIKGAFNAALSFFASLPSRFYSFGSNIIQGLVNGLTSSLRWLRDTITGIGNRISGWFRSTLGIHSPSRVFEQLGGYVTDGLSLGLDRGADGPVRRVARIATGMSAALAVGTAAPAAAAGARAGPAGSAAFARAGDTIHFHVYAAPGQSPEDIARAIAAELDRRERQRAAATRSSFEDD